MLTKATLTVILFTTVFTVHGQLEMWGVGSYGGTDQLGVIYRMVGDEYEVVKQMEYDYAYIGVSGESFQVMPDGLLWAAVRAKPSPDGAIIVSYEPSSGTFLEWRAFTTEVGSRPSGNLEPVGSGLMYGTCETGGSEGAGTIFSYSVGENELVGHYQFGADGVSKPLGGLVLHPNGKLYGVAAEGGDFGNGALFSFDPATTEVDLVHHFTATDGFGSCSPLSLTIDGKIFGTRRGDQTDGGTLFSFDASTGLFEKRFDFTATIGRLPEGKLLVDGSGRLWGISVEESGSYRGRLYRYDPQAETYQEMYGFLGSFSNRPVTSPVFTSTGYIAVITTSAYGPAANPPKFLAFNPNTGLLGIQADLAGALPGSLCLASDGWMYGFGGRAVLRVNGAGNMQVATSLSIASLGSRPSSQLIETTSGQIVGMCVQGGASGNGGIFRVDPFSLDYDIVYSFSPFDHQIADASIDEIEPDKVLFVTRTFDSGSLSTLDLVDGTVQYLVGFGGTSVAVPSQDFLRVGNLVYGTSHAGGLYNKGCLWRADLVDQEVDVLHSFGPYTGWVAVNTGTPCELPDGRIMGTMTYWNEGPWAESLMYIYSPFDGSVEITNQISNNSADFVYQDGFRRTANGSYWGTMRRFTGLPASSAITGYDPISGDLSTTVYFDGYYVGGPVVADEQGRVVATLNPFNPSVDQPRLIRWDPADGSVEIVHEFISTIEGRNLHGNILLSSLGVGIDAVERGSDPLIHPNPTVDSFSLRLRGIAPFTIRVMDLHGRTLVEQVSDDDQCAIGTSGLASGTYLVMVRDARSRTSTQRLVKVDGL